MRRALVACVAATLIHHVHNAEFLEHYPDMPSWLSRAAVYGAWLGATLVGIAGYIFLKNGQRTAGATMLVLYAAYCLDGLIHYALAPMAAHSPAMNVSIWLEAAAGAALLASLALRRMS